jgi:cell filamentation protein
VSDWDSLFYPGTDVLRNKLGIQDADELRKAEIEHVELRIREGCPTGNFDLEHLQAIHRHLFQDVYEWAGQLRTFDMFKNQEGEYSPAGEIESEIRGVHQRVVNLDFLHNTNVSEFSAKAAQIIGDTNHAHPFREGNTRTQLQFLHQLAEGAGHNIDLAKIDRGAWNVAKVQAGDGNYDYMNDQIRAAIVPTLERAPPVADPAWEKIFKDDDALRVKELQDQRDAQQEALKNIITGVENRGNNPIERDQKLRDFEEKCKQQVADKLREQQERLERLELLRKGPPTGRERE